MLRTASQRRLAWALVFGVVLVLPLGEFWSPRWQLPLVDLRHDYLTWTLPVGPLALPVAAWALLIWFFGAGWALVRLTNDGRAARGLLARATPVAPNELAASLGAQVFGDRIVSPASGPIRMAWTAELETAAVMGWHHPTILLPDTARSWTPEMLRAALLHEREHIREHDWLIMNVERLVVALYWPNPLVWAARRRAAVTREIAADDAVIRADIAPSSYARQLLDLSRSRSRHGTAPLRAAVGLGGASVAPRVRALFASTRSHATATGKMRRAIIAATITVALPALALQPMLCR